MKVFYRNIEKCWWIRTLGGIEMSGPWILECLIICIQNESFATCVSSAREERKLRRVAKNRLYSFHLQTLLRWPQSVDVLAFQSWRNYNHVKPAACSCEGWRSLLPFQCPWHLRYGTFPSPSSPDPYSSTPLKEYSWASRSALKYRVQVFSRMSNLIRRLALYNSKLDRSNFEV